MSRITARMRLVLGSVGKIFDKAQIVGVTDLHDAIHVGDMAAHVGEHESFDIICRRLFFQTIQINGVVVGDFHKFNGGSCVFIRIVAHLIINPDVLKLYDHRFDHFFITN